MHLSGMPLRELVIRSTVEDITPTDDESPLFLGTSVDNYLVIDPGSRSVVTELDRPIDVTIMGFDILASFARHPNKVRNHADLLRDSGSQSTVSVKVPLKRVRDNLAPHHDHLIQSVRGIGYLGILSFDPEDIPKTKK